MGARTGALEQRFARAHENLADEIVARSEPAVDGRAAEAELACDRMHVDALAAHIAFHRQREHVLAARVCGPAARLSAWFGLDRGLGHDAK